MSLSFGGFSNNEADCHGLGRLRSVADMSDLGWHIKNMDPGKKTEGAVGAVERTAGIGIVVGI